MKLEIVEYIEAMHEAVPFGENASQEIAMQCAYVYCSPMDIFKVWFRLIKFKFNIQ